uniref:Ig-like domain-containing protein n=1 Tax=Maylandia zebra TaxID=106582 RepID=A0A3P9D3K9_9CICH
VTQTLESCSSIPNSSAGNHIQTAPSLSVVTLYPNWSEIYRGETITVRCEIHGGDTEWNYEWKTNSNRKPQNLNEYRIISASSSNSGNYRCKGRMKSSQHETTEWSDSVTLTVSDSKSCLPVVTLYPNWSEIYRGETITVRCEIHGGDTEWDYEWVKNSIRKLPNQNEYRIISASSSNSGNYRCKGRVKSSQHETTEWSDSVTLTVSDSKSCLLRLLFFRKSLATFFSQICHFNVETFSLLLFLIEMMNKNTYWNNGHTDISTLKQYYYYLYGLPC